MAEGKFADAAVRALGRMARENQGRTDGRQMKEATVWNMTNKEKNQEERHGTSGPLFFSFLFFSFLFFSFVSFVACECAVCRMRFLGATARALCQQSTSEL